MTTYKLELTRAELDALLTQLDETAMEMDDDGREGAFDASPLRPIWEKALKLRGPRLGGGTR